MLVYEWKIVHVVRIRDKFCIASSTIPPPHSCLQCKRATSASVCVASGGDGCRSDADGGFRVFDIFVPVI